MTEGAGMTKLADKVLARRAGVILALLNLGGAAAYASLDVMNWMKGQDRLAQWKAGLHPAATGDALIVGLIIVLIWACFFALNVGWGTVILCYRQWRSGLFWLGAFLIWLIAFTIGHFYH